MIQRQLAKDICQTYIRESTDIDLNVDVFLAQWQDFTDYDLLDKPITFGSKPQNTGERNVFGYDLDPITEAILLGVAVNYLYDCLKYSSKAVFKLKEILTRQDFQSRLINSLGEIDERQIESARLFIQWLSSNIHRWRDELEIWLSRHDKGSK